MNKLGIFVEGHTEVVFVEKLVEEIAGKNNVLIEQRKIRGGSNTRRTFAHVQAARVDTGQAYYVLIVDCGGDALVKTRVLEEHENFTRQGYSKIIGIRDIRPDFARADLPRLERELPRYIRTSLIPVEFILAVMEVEAWFLAEATHYAKIDPGITVAAIRSTLRFDPEVDDMEQRNFPATDLNDCYAIGGKHYWKGAAGVTINAIDFEQVYFHLVEKFAYVKRLVSSIEAFLI